jgi:hypothetical protein
MSQFRQLPNSTLLGAFALGVLVLLAGCGSGDSTAAQQDETISFAQYIQRADAICTKTDKVQKKLATKVGEEGANLQSKEGLEVLVVKAALPPLDDEARELAELQLPAREAKKAERYLAAVHKGIKFTEEEPLALPNAEPGPFNEAEEIARSVGFKVCRGA